MNMQNRLSFRATIIVEMKDPTKYGFPEPTIKSLVKMIKKGDCEVDTTEIALEPVLIIKQK